jgi:hypothetical protein
MEIFCVFPHSFVFTYFTDVFPKCTFHCVDVLIILLVVNLLYVYVYYYSMVLPYPLRLLRVCSDCVLCTMRWLVLVLRKCLTIYNYCINVVLDVTCIFVVCNFQNFFFTFLEYGFCHPVCPFRN